MHRIIFMIMLTSMILSCATSSGQFEVIDAYGRVYSSGEIARQLQNEFRLEHKPKILLLLTESVGNIKFEEQLKIVKGINAETYQYIYVI